MSGWDTGVRWYPRRTVAPNFAYDAIEIAEVRDQHLKAGTALEDGWIDRAWRTTYRRAERVTRRPLIPQTWQQIMSGFPCGPIVVDKSPFLSVVSFEYIDSDGVTQQLAGSPADYTVIAASGDNPTRAEIHPLYNESWPSTRAVPNAVTLTYTCGYPLVNNIAAVPEDITHGRLLMLGELYKQRSLSVHAFNQNPAIIQADTIWKEYRSY